MSESQVRLRNRPRPYQITLQFRSLVTMLVHEMIYCSKAFEVQAEGGQLGKICYNP